MSTVPVVQVEHLSVDFAIPTGPLRAVDDVSFTVAPGDVFALVGESGCGKSTLAAALMNLIPEPGRIVGGDVVLKGESIVGAQPSRLRQLRAVDVSTVFQAAMSSFNPVVTIGAHVDHVLEAHPDIWPRKKDGVDYFRNLLELVRLPVRPVLDGFESQFSGGMKQRIAIALALLLKPAVVVLDEPTTALDVINQRTVIEVLQDLHEHLDLTIIFVTHDLALVAELATSVGVMYAGRLVQHSEIDEVFYDSRRHPYVEALLQSIPDIFDAERRAQSIPGAVPQLDNLPPGCRFAPRCPAAEEICHRVDPPLMAGNVGSAIACHVVNASLVQEGGPHGAASG